MRAPFPPPWRDNPRLLAGSPAERTNLELIGTGEGVHWPDPHEDFSLESALAGRPTAESLASFQRWLSIRSPRLAGT